MHIDTVQAIARAVSEACEAERIKPPLINWGVRTGAELIALLVAMGSPESTVYPWDDGKVIHAWAGGCAGVPMRVQAPPESPVKEDREVAE